MAYVVDCKTIQCQNSVINCLPYHDCFVSCDDKQACVGSVINCPLDGNCEIDCDGANSCVNATFNGSDASTLEITGCFYDTCSDLSIICPPNTNGFTNCIIQGNNRNTKIYAIHGWKDILIDYNGTFGFFHNGQMFCGNNYDISCDIAADDWSCANIDDFCNNVDVTSDPTANPTINPSDTTEIIRRTGTTLQHNDSLMLQIVISIAAISVIIGCIFCINRIRRWFAVKSDNNTDNIDTHDSFDFVMKTTMNVDNDISDNRDFVSDNEGSIVVQKKISADPLDVSSVVLQLQPQRSRTNTFLSAAISDDGSIKIPDIIPAPARRMNSSKWEGNLPPLSSNNSDISENMDRIKL